jgi:hypothetical protein
MAREFERELFVPGPEKAQVPESSRGILVGIIAIERGLMQKVSLRQAARGLCPGSTGILSDLGGCVIKEFMVRSPGSEIAKEPPTRIIRASVWEEAHAQHQWSNKHEPD